MSVADLKSGNHQNCESVELYDPDNPTLDEDSIEFIDLEPSETNSVDDVGPNGPSVTGDRSTVVSDVESETTNDNNSRVNANASVSDADELTFAGRINNDILPTVDISDAVEHDDDYYSVKSPSSDSVASVANGDIERSEVEENEVTMPATQLLESATSSKSERTDSNANTNEQGKTVVDKIDIFAAGIAATKHDEPKTTNKNDSILNMFSSIRFKPLQQSKHPPKSKSKFNKMSIVNVLELGVEDELEAEDEMRSWLAAPPGAASIIAPVPWVAPAPKMIKLNRDTPQVSSNEPAATTSQDLTSSNQQIAQGTDQSTVQNKTNTEHSDKPLNIRVTDDDPDGALLKNAIDDVFGINKEPKNVRFYRANDQSTQPRVLRLSRKIAISNTDGVNTITVQVQNEASDGTNDNSSSVRLNSDIPDAKILVVADAQKSRDVIDIRNGNESDGECSQSQSSPNMTPVRNRAQEQKAKSTPLGLTTDFSRRRQEDTASKGKVNSRYEPDGPLSEGEVRDDVDEQDDMYTQDKKSGKSSDKKSDRKRKHEKSTELGLTATGNKRKKLTKSPEGMATSLVKKKRSRSRDKINSTGKKSRGYRRHSVDSRDQSWSRSRSRSYSRSWSVDSYHTPHKSRDKRSISRERRVKSGSKTAKKDRKVTPLSKRNKDTGSTSRTRQRTPSPATKTTKVKNSRDKLSKSSAKRTSGKEQSLTRDQQRTPSPRKKKGLKSDKKMSSSTKHGKDKDEGWRKESQRSTSPKPHKSREESTIHKHKRYKKIEEYSDDSLDRSSDDSYSQKRKGKKHRHKRSRSVKKRKNRSLSVGRDMSKPRDQLSADVESESELLGRRHRSTSVTIRRTIRRSSVTNYSPPREANSTLELAGKLASKHLPSLRLSLFDACMKTKYGPDYSIKNLPPTMVTCLSSDEGEDVEIVSVKYLSDKAESDASDKASDEEGEVDEEITAEADIYAAEQELAKIQALLDKQRAARAAKTGRNVESLSDLMSDKEDLLSNISSTDSGDDRLVIASCEELSASGDEESAATADQPRIIRLDRPATETAIIKLTRDEDDNSQTRVIRLNRSEVPDSPVQMAIAGRVKSPVLDKRSIKLTENKPAATLKEPPRVATVKEPKSVKEMNLIKEPLAVPLNRENVLIPPRQDVASAAKEISRQKECTIEDSVTSDKQICQKESRRDRDERSNLQNSKKQSKKTAKKKRSRDDKKSSKLKKKHSKAEKSDRSRKSREEKESRQKDERERRLRLEVDSRMNRNFTEQEMWAARQQHKLEKLNRDKQMELSGRRLLRDEVVERYDAIRAFHRDYDFVREQQQQQQQLQYSMMPPLQRQPILMWRQPPTQPIIPAPLMRPMGPPVTHDVGLTLAPGQLFLTGTGDTVRVLPSRGFYNTPAIIPSGGTRQRAAEIPTTLVVVQTSSSNAPSRITDSVVAKNQPRPAAMGAAVPVSRPTAAASQIRPTAAGQVRPAGSGQPRSAGSGQPVTSATAAVPKTKQKSINVATGIIPVKLLIPQRTKKVTNKQQVAKTAEIQASKTPATQPVQHTQQQPVKTPTVTVSSSQPAAKTLISNKSVQQTLTSIDTMKPVSAVQLDSTSQGSRLTTPADSTLHAVSQPPEVDSSSSNSIISTAAAVSLASPARTPVRHATCSQPLTPRSRLKLNRKSGLLSRSSDIANTPPSTSADETTASLVTDGRQTEISSLLELAGDSGDDVVQSTAEVLLDILQAVTGASEVGEEQVKVSSTLLPETEEQVDSVVSQESDSSSASECSDEVSVDMEEDVQQSGDREHESLQVDELVEAETDDVNSCNSESALKSDQQSSGLTPGRITDQQSSGLTPGRITDQQSSGLTPGRITDHYVHRVRSKTIEVSTQQQQDSSTDQAPEDTSAVTAVEMNSSPVDVNTATFVESEEAQVLSPASAEEDFEESLSPEISPTSPFAVFGATKSDRIPGICEEGNNENGDESPQTSESGSPVLLPHEVFRKSDHIPGIGDASPPYSDEEDSPLSPYTDEEDEAMATPQKHDPRLAGSLQQPTAVNYSTTSGVRQVPQLHGRHAGLPFIPLAQPSCAEKLLDTLSSYKSLPLTRPTEAVQTGAVARTLTATDIATGLLQATLLRSGAAAAAAARPPLPATNIVNPLLQALRPGGYMPIRPGIPTAAVAPPSNVNTLLRPPVLPSSVPPALLPIISSLVMSRPVAPTLSVQAVNDLQRALGATSSRSAAGVSHAGPTAPGVKVPTTVYRPPVPTAAAKSNSSLCIPLKTLPSLSGPVAKHKQEIDFDIDDVASPLSDEIMSFSPPSSPSDLRPVTTTRSSQKTSQRTTSKPSSRLRTIHKTNNKTSAGPVHLTPQQKAEQLKRVAREFKQIMQPYYKDKRINKEEYKDIMRKAVPRICHSRTGDSSIVRMTRYADAYVHKVIMMRKYMAKKQKLEQQRQRQQKKRS